MSFVNICEEIDCVITAPHCIRYVVVVIDVFQSLFLIHLAVTLQICLYLLLALYILDTVMACYHIRLRLGSLMFTNAALRTLVGVFTSFNKHEIKAPNCVCVWGEGDSSDNWWIPFRRGQYYGKCHIMRHTQVRENLKIFYQKHIFLSVFSRPLLALCIV